MLDTRDAARRPADDADRVGVSLLLHRELAGAPLGAQDLEPVADAEVLRRIAREVAQVDLLEQLDHAAARSEAEGTVQPGVERVGIDQRHALPSRAREPEPGIGGHPRLRFACRQRRDHDLADSLFRKLMQSGCEWVAFDHRFHSFRLRAHA